MESGTLDFEDLMDTGDFPGFEIAKFTPATDDKESEGDGILRTPEHRREDDDEDYVQHNPKDKPITQNGEHQDIKDQVDKDVNDREEPEGVEGETKPRDIEGGETKPRDTEEKMESDGFVVEVADGWEEKEEEPAPKKKKMSLLPASSKPKMKLWGGNKHKEETPNHTVHKQGAEDTNEAGAVNDGSGKENTNNSVEGQSEPKKDGVSPKLSPKVSPKTGDKENGEDEENPHQQSFLSFFNLQPGSSKSKDETAQKKEKTKAEDFYSRKRLRTRKKVSYCEDVVADLDEDYKDTDEEMPFDHEISLPRRRRSSAGKEPPKPLAPKASPVNSAITAAAKYAEALKKLSQMHNTVVASPSLLKPIKPSSQPQKFTSVLPTLKTTPVVDVSMEDDQMSNGPMKGLFECGLCGTFFNTAGQFISHQESVHSTNTATPKTGRPGMETFRCEICSFVLTNRFAYLEHKRMKHSKNQVTFNCNKCGSSFGYLIDLQKHKQVCGLPYTYTCTHCNLTLKDAPEMATHNQKFHPQNFPSMPQPATPPAVPGRQWLSCAVRNCSFKSLTQMEMKHHVMKNHNLQGKNMVNELYPCNAPRCSKIFSTREKLTEHKREVHASEFIVQYQCMECKICYSTKTLLAEHQYLHMMDKMKKCDICMRRFSTYSQLIKHKEVHASKGMYRCTACTRWCYDKEELATHVCREKRSKLLGLRIYFCDICQKDFKNDGLMFIHRQEHKKFYQCSTCKWEGSEEEEYFKHRENHGLFTCRECCEEIPTETEMATHRKAHKYYIKMEEVEEDDGKPVSVMYLCPNLMNAIKV